MLTYTTIKNIPGYNTLEAKSSMWSKTKLEKNIKIFDDFLNSNKKFFMNYNKTSRMNRDCVKELRDLLKSNLDWNNMTYEQKQSYYNANETNVNENLPKKSPKTIAKPKKNNYIKTTNETKTTNSNGDKTMITKNEIAKIAPNAVKNILAAQKINKTDTKKTYWGGWAKVHVGMNAAYNDYAKYQNLETEWLELRQKLGGTKSPLYHFCWKLINSNRVGVKQEPNSTLRFIKNVKIRIAMANDVLANKDTYKNEIAENWKSTFGTEI